MNKNALICEDNLTTASFIKLMFEKMGYQSDIVQNAQEALELLDKKNYDILTLDIMLPDRNGLDLLKEIKSSEKYKRLPVVIISAMGEKYSNLNNEEEFVYWFEKSFDYESFQKLITEIFTNQHKDKLKILHLEDDNDVLYVVNLMLSSFAEVTAVNTIVEAEILLNQSKFDLLILDYMLLDGTCDKITENIKNTINKDAKLVLFSAYEPASKLAKEVDQVILKTSVSSEEFINQIKKITNQY